MTCAHGDKVGEPLLSELLNEEAQDRRLESELEFISRFDLEFGLCWQMICEEEILQRQFLARTQLRQLFALSAQHHPHPSL